MTEFQPLDIPLANPGLLVGHRVGGGLSRQYGEILLQIRYMPFQNPNAGVESEVTLVIRREDAPFLIEDLQKALRDLPHS